MVLFNWNPGYFQHFCYCVVIYLVILVQPMNTYVEFVQRKFTVMMQLFVVIRAINGFISHVMCCLLRITMIWLKTQLPIPGFAKFVVDPKCKTQTELNEWLCSC